MVLEIGYTCIVAGLLLILGLAYFSKQKIGLLITKAVFILSVPILLLWIFSYFGFSVMEEILFYWPYQITFYTTLIIFAFKYSGFTKNQILPFFVFLIGYILVYFGLFLILYVGTLRIGF